MLTRYRTDRKFTLKKYNTSIFGPAFESNPNSRVILELLYCTMRGPGSVLEALLLVNTMDHLYIW